MENEQKPAGLPALRNCPWCDRALSISNLKYNPLARCDTEGCWMHERAIAFPVDDPRQVAGFNRRPGGQRIGDMIAVTGAERFDLIPEGDHAKLLAAAVEMADALKVFAVCADEIDVIDKGHPERGASPDEEWAKFRLTVGDYRKARAAIRTYMAAVLETAHGQ